MSLRKRAFARFGAVVVCCAIAAACTPEDGPLEPTPTPTSATPSPSPTETDQEREERLAYEAAETAYRTFRAEYDRITTHGYSPTTSQVMRDNAYGPYLKGYDEFIKGRRADKVRSTAPINIVYIKRDGYSSKEVILNVCEDGSSVRLLNSKGKMVGKGSVVEGKLTVRRQDSRWKIWDVDQKVVESCGD